MVISWANYFRFVGPPKVNLKGEGWRRVGEWAAAHRPIVGIGLARAMVGPTLAQ